MISNDNIAAIATSMNSSGIGIIRISGPDSISIADKLYRGKKKLSECESHTVNYGHIYDGDKIVDEAMVLIMKAPRSYTTEDTVEIDCHGGIYVLKQILNLVINNGARPAEPGEFTKRAFLNGRIDLSQAEAVMDLISSKNEFAMKNSLSHLSGSLKNKISEIRENILTEVAYIEAALDDPEHYDLTGYTYELSDKVNKFKSQVDDLSKSFKSGHILKEGINTLILGKPNAGKSSVLNALSGRDRAIVTDIPGTTRDILEEQIIINGIYLNIIDTAGIRDTDDVVEKIGVSKAVSLVDEADLILFVVDSSSELDDNDLSIVEKIKNRNVIVLLNKSDLETKITEADICKIIDKNVVSISAKNLNGITKLHDLIAEMFLNGDINSNDEIYITNARQQSSLVDCSESLLNVINGIELCMPEDLLTVDLIDAYVALGKITGETIEDDLADKIFSEFCMGK